MIELERPVERVILLAVSTGKEEEAYASLEELSQLAKTAGAMVVGKAVQNLEAVNPATYFGSGKLLEVERLLRETDATGVICDDELTPVQMRNMNRVLDTKIMDRTLLILDIFASRAKTREGKIQVELAQLRYRAVHLIGLRDSFSRLGGGIGTRGPGEKKLEMDRRLIHRRIGQLKEELAQVKRHREVTRKKRQKEGLPVIAMVGYTNAGKSTLFQAVTGSETFVEDLLFATLDPLTKTAYLPDGEKILLTDTVGFIKKLPHHLVEAFQSTLEEAKYADLILHVVDASNPQMEVQMHVVYETLKTLGIEGKEILTVFNKMDRFEGKKLLMDFQASGSLCVCAKTGEGIPELLSRISQTLKEGKVYVEKCFSYEEAGKIQWIRNFGKLISEEYREDGIWVKGYVPEELSGRM